MRVSIALVAALLGFVGEAAYAAPSPFNSTTPQCISLVGTFQGIPDVGNGAFTVVVRDGLNQPMPGAQVKVFIPDFVFIVSSCMSGVVEHLGYWEVPGIANSQGRVDFVIQGWSTSGAGCPATPGEIQGAGRIEANGVNITVLHPSGGVSISAYDLDGGGVSANDLSLWLGDFGQGCYNSRDDYDCSGGIGAGDLSLWLGVYGQGTSVSQSCSSPPGGSRE